MSQFPAIFALAVSLVGTGTVLTPETFENPVEAAEVQSIAQPIAPAGKRIVVERAEDGLFYLPMQVNGTPVRFLVDTGSNMVILPSKVARATGVDQIATTAQARTVSGSSTLRMAHIARIEVAGRVLRDMPTAVQSNDGMPPILGMNALAKFGRIMISGDRLAFEPA